jgi:EAL domain-containing protein (putative c-di-GMP-specific phosphodiesterase class I)
VPAADRLTSAEDRLLLGRVLGIVAPHLDDHVEAFYATLAQRPGPAAVVDRLADGELAQIKRAQADHVRDLVDPATDVLQIIGRSRQVGRVHAMVGVEMTWYLEAVADHQRGLFDLIGRSGLPEASRAVAALSQRFMHDLQGTVQGYRDIDAAQARVLNRVSEAVADARTVADLSRGVLEGLSLLDGVASVFIGRPDETGAFQFEAGAGDGVEELIAWTQQPGALVVSTSPHTAVGRGPAGRAWRTGEIARSDSYRCDPDTEPWWAWAERFRWRSSVAVPLMDAHGLPYALLSLYASYPGYFAYEARLTMLEQVRSLVQRAFEALEQLPNVAAEVQGYSDRTAHLAALEEGRVEMVYQPIVSLPDGRLLQLEALARLRDGDRLVGPAEFLPAFGDEELLRLFEIGLDRALADLVDWQRQGLRTGVSVNMPVVAARDDRYVQIVAETLARYDVEPGRLTLELLETGHMLGSLAARRAGLDRFKRLGVRLAQDDLGSGYSSLLRLRHFAFDLVKIDQSLVRGTEFAPRAALHFVQPIRDIAHGLGLRVTLEGLEDEGLIEAAVQLGVDSGQGYGIARPMPGTAVPGWAREYRLDVDSARPSTDLGGLAAHVAWHHRLSAVGPSVALTLLHAPASCGLTGYLDRPGAEELREAHATVHRHALADPAADPHRAAWDRLVGLLGDGAAGSPSGAAG